MRRIRAVVPALPVLLLGGLHLTAGWAAAQGFGFVLQGQWRIGPEAVQAAVFGPDGAWIAVAAGSRCSLFALDEEGRTSLRGVLLPEARKAVLGLAVSPDGGTVARVDASGALALFDSASLALVAYVERAHSGRARAVAFTADGSYVVTGGQDGKVRVWTARGDSFAELAKGMRHDKEVVMVAGVPPGRSAISVGRDRRVILWEIDTQQAVRPTGVDMDVLSAHLGGGKVLALGLQRLVGNRSRLSTLPSAHEVEATDTVRLIDAETGMQLRDLEGEEQDLDTVIVTPDGRFVAAAGSGEWATVWDAATGKRITSIPFEKPVTALAFAPSGRWMLTGTEDGRLALYRLTGVGPALVPAAPGQIIIVIIDPPTSLPGRGGEARIVPEIATSSLKIRGRISSPVPLASVQVDGAEVTSLVEAESGDQIFTAYVPLPHPGSRRVEVVVQNQAGAVARETLAVERAAQVRAFDPGKGRRMALIVGISRYADPSVNLEYADDDAQALHDLLTSQALGPAAFRREDVLLLLNEQATLARINTGLRQFLQQADANDFVLVFFAGHGVPDPNRLQDLYLMAHDTRPADVAGTGLLMRHFREAISELEARDVLILSDACHSAGIGAPKSIRSLTANPIHQVFLDRMRHASGGLAILTASESAQVSVEGDRWGKHGVFTYYLLRGLGGAADEDGDRIVTLGEMMEYVRQQVKDATESRQVPAIGPTSFDRQFPVVVVGAKR